MKEGLLKRSISFVMSRVSTKWGHEIAMVTDPGYRRFSNALTHVRNLNGMIHVDVHDASGVFIKHVAIPAQNDDEVRGALKDIPAGAQLRVTMTDSQGGFLYDLRGKQTGQ